MEELNLIEKIQNFEREKGWFGVDEYFKYEGFWYTENFLEVIMAAQANFKAKSNDIFIATHWKTGTTWLKALAFAIATRSMSSSPLLNKVPHDCIPFLELDLSNPDQSTNHRLWDLPLVATHLPHGSLPRSVIDSRCKIVYIWRDPKDVFVSFWYFLDKVRTLMTKIEPPPPVIPLEEAFDLLCRGISFYGPYWDHVLSYWKVKLEFPEKVLFLKYEEMKRDTRFYVEKLAEFIGYPFSVEERENGVVEKIISMCNFENLSELEVNKVGTHRGNSPLAVSNNVYFRKGKVGDWKNELTPEMSARLDTITKQKFSNTGLL